MKKKKTLFQQIPVQAIRNTHPAPEIGCPTDLYYTRIANDIFKHLANDIQKGNFTESEARKIAINIAAYFEDQVSEFGLWRAFVTKHKEMFGKWLPFYNTDEEYYEDEVNIQDVAFIIWQTLTAMRNGRIVNPENFGLNLISIGIYSILEKEFEKAPINEAMKLYIYFPEHLTTFLPLKLMCNWLVSRSYLFSTSRFLSQDIDNLKNTFLGSLNMKSNPSIAEYSAISAAGIDYCSAPLALKPKEWLATMCQLNGIDKDTIDDILNLEGESPNVYFIHKVEKDDYIQVESVEGKEYTIDYDSFEEGSGRSRLTENRIMIAQIAKYRDRWHINGFASFFEDEKPEVAKQKFEAMKVSQKEKDSQNPELLHSPETVAKAMKKYRGRRLFFFHNSNEASQWWKETFGQEFKIGAKEQESFKNGMLLFFTDDYRTLLSNSVEAIKDRSNPAYDKEAAMGEALHLLGDRNSAPKELVTYLIDKKLLPDARFNSMLGPRRGKAQVQENMRFIARFLRNEPI